MDIVRIFNFSNEISKRIVRTSVRDLSLAEDITIVKTNEHEGVPNAENQLKDMSSAVGGEDISVSSEEAILDSTPSDTFPGSKLCKAPKPGGNASSEAIKLWRENGFSSLIIAAPEQDAWTIVKDLLPLLSYSAPFAIYHQYLQPLATCMHNLQIEKMAIGLQISEPWLREYQVLPSRTHPHMQMSSFGGYVLSGTRICSSSS
ncbi:tRNA (adenine(58)-N(1))-methyltransferase non-catalytic subunit TRM6 [Carica papaya]|uniref:tRNA (adenine(58)-N(1))-methyltransferase non-catalytic subunit TRM6 n=1 Tax=Carica papaya TaxID=3649 RepID=UPI000B8D08B2|nr:tRNA (adenine(58)-N(1))-methyltransferase non-catalytic subunit TRM6 [Carica papaya]